MNTREMDDLTAELTSKAAKARALSNAGVSTGDIGRYLGIRYQHVYNILLRAGLIEKTQPAEDQGNPDTPIIVGQVNADGGIDLPKDILQRYGLAVDSTVYCSALPNGLMLLSREAALEHITRIARERMPEQVALIEALLKSGSDRTRSD